MKKIYFLILAIIILPFLLNVYLYPKMPDVLASHWNLKGEVDGYISKFWGLFLLPIISIGLFLIFILVPKLIL